MDKRRGLTIIVLAATLAACGSNFEWFPKASDTTPPAVTASISGVSIFSNRSTHVPALPATVTFYANEPATIFYTTNGSDPTTASHSVGISSANGATGPSITVTDTILKFFGRDQSANSSAIQTAVIKSP